MPRAIIAYMATDQKICEKRPVTTKSRRGIPERKRISIEHSKTMVAIAREMRSIRRQSGGGGAGWDRSSEPQVAQKVAPLGFLCPLGQILPSLYGVLPQYGQYRSLLENALPQFVQILIINTHFL